MIDQLRLVRGKNHGEKESGRGGHCWWANFMYFPRVEKLGEEFRIYPCLGYTLSSDGKTVVEEGMPQKGPHSQLWDRGFQESTCVVSDCLRDGGGVIKNDTATR